jgi:hypothetical protein
MTAGSAFGAHRSGASSLASSKFCALYLGVIWGFSVGGTCIVQGLIERLRACNSGQRILSLKLIMAHAYPFGRQFKSVKEIDSF